MEVGELLKVQTEKNKLKKQRDHLIKQEIKKKQKQRVNLDQSAVKKGYIEKRKYIQKKNYQTFTEKAKKTAVKIQQNVNPNTYLSHSQTFLKTLERTKQKVKFQRLQYEESITALRAFGLNQRIFSIAFTLHFEKDIDCQPHPFLIKVPFPNLSERHKEVVIVLDKIKQKDEGTYSFQSIQHLNLKVMSHSEFQDKMNNDNVFHRKVSQQYVKCLVKFEVYKAKKFYEGLLKKGIVVFPIDSKKVPFTLQQTIQSYPQYIEYVTQHFFAVAKSGSQHTFKLHMGSNEALLQNSQAIIYELAAKLFERSKNKQNSLKKVTAKTPSSLSFELYKASNPDEQVDS